jgi:hypothetical protein
MRQRRWKPLEGLVVSAVEGLVLSPAEGLVLSAVEGSEVRLRPAVV